MKYVIDVMVSFQAIWPMVYGGRFRRNGGNEAIELRPPSLITLVLNIFGFIWMES